MGVSEMEWRGVPDWPDYEVSDAGAVRRKTASRGTVAGRPLKAPPEKATGYPRVTLRRDGRSCRIAVHQLVAAAFIGPRPPNYDIDHKDGDRTRSSLDNLEYVTRSTNMHRAVARRGAWGAWQPGVGHHRVKLTPENVAEIREWRNRGLPLIELARRFGVNHTTIYGVANGVTWREKSQ